MFGEGGLAEKNPVRARPERAQNGPEGVATGRQRFVVADHVHARCVTVGTVWQQLSVAEKTKRSMPGPVRNSMSNSHGGPAEAEEAEEQEDENMADDDELEGPDELAGDGGPEAVADGSSQADGARRTW